MKTEIRAWCWPGSRGAPAAKAEVGPAQADWLHTALLFGDTRITLASFAVVNWDYR